MYLIFCLVRQVRIELSKSALIVRQLSPREYWEIILCLVRQVRIELSKEALIIRQLSRREYCEKFVSISDGHVSPDMSEGDWARLFGWKGSVL